jgi:FMN-dependent NADH-azoreductase
MPKVLYITANPKVMEKSFSLTIGNTFLNEYKKSNPKDEIMELDLYSMDIQPIDRDVLDAWGKLTQGIQFADLSDALKKKLEKIESSVQLFMSADKYIFVSPLWNLGVPPILKAYIDTVVIVGKTFKYTENGPVGILNNKKAVHIEACGGVYSQGPSAAYEGGARYLKIILGFMGITDEEVIFVEGINQFPEKADEIREQGKQKALEMAKRF